MPTFTNIDDTGQYIVEYDKIHYNLISSDYTINCYFSYPLLEDGSDKGDYETDAIAKCNAIADMFPGNTWILVKNVTYQREEYIPEIPMTQEEFIPSSP